MAESPFAFFRGAAIVMAADLGRQPHPGPFEWDVQRLAASFVLAARSLELSENQ